MKQWLESPVSKPFRHLWLGQIGQEQVSLIMLGREHDPEVLAPLFEEMSGVEYVNQVERISALFTLYREETEGIVALAYGVIFIFLLWKYRIRKALQILAPPALATLLTFAILSLSGQNLNLFNFALRHHHTSFIWTTLSQPNSSTGFSRTHDHTRDWFCICSQSTGTD